VRLAEGTHQVQVLSAVLELQQAHAAARFIQQIDRFVREEAVADVSLR